MDEFFKTDRNYINKKDKQKWSSSVENLLTKNSQKRNQFLPPKTMARALPGGKYGCAQYLKCCGGEIFKQCSLGKLSLLAQEAI